MVQVAARIQSAVLLMLFWSDATNYFRNVGKAADESFLCVSFCYTASSPARRAAIIPQKLS